MKLDKMTFNWKSALALFRLGTELLNKLPRRGDSKLDVLVKLLAMADSVDKVYGGKTAAYDDIFAEYDLEARTSEPFVRLFFDTAMSKVFTIRRHVITEHLSLIEGVAPGGGRIFFQEFRWGNRPEVASEFFHTKGFDFSTTMDALWAGFPHGLFLSVKPSKNGYGSDVTFSPMGAPRTRLIDPEARAAIAEGAEEWQSRSGEPWCFIAYGPPGTGKTQYVRGLAAAVGGRLLKIDASSLPRLGLQEVTFLLDALAPKVVLIDDFDRAPVDDTLARLFFLFEHLHDLQASITVGVTVNKATKIAEALLRSERIDSAKEFPLPIPAARAFILREHAAIIVPGRIDAAALAELVTATEGFNHADLVGLVRRFKTKTVAAAMKDMKKLRDLAAESAKEEAAPGAPGATPASSGNPTPR